MQRERDIVYRFILISIVIALKRQDKMIFPYTMKGPFYVSSAVGNNNNDNIRSDDNISNGNNNNNNSNNNKN